jgi:hypothetical protein
MVAWMALLVVLGAALMPAVSHAMAAAASDRNSQSDICSADHAGATAANVHSGHDSPLPGDLHFDHCPFCLNHAGNWALPPSAATILPVAENTSPRPFLFFHAPHPLFTWATRPARAPPA